MLPAIFVLIGAAIVLAIVYFQSTRRKKLVAAASEIGFVPIDPDELRITEVPLFGHRGGNVRLAMLGTAGGCEAYLFEFEERSGRSTRNQTVIGFIKSDINLPMFQLHRRSLTERISAAFAGDRVEIPGNSEFERNFILRGPDPESVKQYFQATIITYLLGLPEDSWILEGSADSLILYRSGKGVSPQNIVVFVQRMSTIAQGFLSVVPRAYTTH